jgi:hypothetical protein
MPSRRARRVQPPFAAAVAGPAELADGNAELDPRCAHLLAGRRRPVPFASPSCRRWMWCRREGPADPQPRSRHVPVRRLPDPGRTDLSAALWLAPTHHRRRWSKSASSYPMRRKADITHENTRTTTSIATRLARHLRSITWQPDPHRPWRRGTSADRPGRAPDEKVSELSFDTSRGSSPGWSLKRRVRRRMS